ncbi:hypothetical protein GCM10017711_41460 [Paeniglutamicibacter sulfureus]
MFGIFKVEAQGLADGLWALGQELAAAGASRAGGQSGHFANLFGTNIGHGHFVVSGKIHGNDFTGDTPKGRNRQRFRPFGLELYELKD